MNKNNENQGIALITGASSGIGAAFAGKLSEIGFNTILVARRELLLREIAEKLEKTYNIKAEVLVADLSTDGGISLVEKRINELNNLSMLINCAGFGVKGFFQENNLDKRLDMINVHITATVRLTHTVLSGMLNHKKGTIINVSSLGAFMYSPSSSIYSASKMFLITFTRVLEVELRGSGVQVLTICPGFTHTSFHDVSGHDKNKIPNFLWMNAESVVKKSLKALKRKKIIFIPGFKNRTFLRLFRFPLTSWLVKRLLFKGAKQDIEKKS